MFAFYIIFSNHVSIPTLIRGNVTNNDSKDSNYDNLVAMITMILVMTVTIPILSLPSPPFLPTILLSPPFLSLLILPCSLHYFPSYLLFASLPVPIPLLPIPLLTYPPRLPPLSLIPSFLFLPSYPPFPLLDSPSFPLLFLLSPSHLPPSQI